jgi:hypothetical protein
MLQRSWLFFELSRYLFLSDLKKLAHNTIDIKNDFVKTGDFIYNAFIMILSRLYSLMPGCHMSFLASWLASFKIKSLNQHQDLLVRNRNTIRHVYKTVASANENS